MTKTNDAADLSALDTISACNKPFEFELVHPVNRTGLGIFWSVVGKDSDVYRARIRGLADENLRRSNAGLPPMDNTLSKLEAKNVDTLAAASTGWRSEGKPGVVVWKGEELSFTPENVKRVLTELPAAREQVQEKVNDLGNWLGG